REHPHGHRQRQAVPPQDAEQLSVEFGERTVPPGRLPRAGAGLRARLPGPFPAVFLEPEPTREALMKRQGTRASWNPLDRRLPDRRDRVATHANLDNCARLHPTVEESTPVGPLLQPRPRSILPEA